MAASTKKKSTAKSAAKAGNKTASKPKTSAKSSSKTQEPVTPKRREFGAVILLILTLFVTIGYFNSDGKVIADISNLIKGLIGIGYYLVAPIFLIAAFILATHRGRPVTFRLFCAFMLPVLFASMVSLAAPYRWTGEFDLKTAAAVLFNGGLTSKNSGGALGGLIAIGLEKAFSVYASFPLLVLAFIGCALKCFNSGISGVAEKISERLSTPYDPDNYSQPPKPVDTVSAAEAAPAAVKPAPKTAKKHGAFPIDIPLEDDDEPLGLYELTDDPEPAEMKPAPKRARVRRKTDDNPIAEAVDLKQAIPENKSDFAEDDIIDGFKPLPVTKKPGKSTTASCEISDPPKPKKISRADVDAEAEALAQEISIAAEAEESDYQFPPIELLHEGAAAASDGRDEILINKDRLEGALHSFGISSAIVGVIRGPTVTRYDIELEQGVKLSRVTNLAGDLALALGVINVRIAPIPDKISTVGIEVPNKIVSTVFLRDIIESPKFQNAKSRLSFALGKDIGGDCIVGNISKLPHMLIAGTTGSGKSVCMNSLILSLLYKARPDEIKLIMIDPKMVELGVYNGIPHLYVPVVTDPKKAAGALQWSVVEMLKRYRMFSEVGVRNLEGYNEYCKANDQPLLPQVVIVIDELADLMLVASKDVEESICRVAQMGRAAGMHLVIATQRPSADVITGLMKANIPSRIAFAVSSAMESRIILDQSGAEKLVGMGDMLYSPVGCGKPTRIQGAFVSDEEREEIVQFIKEGSAAAAQNSEIEEYMNKAAESKGGSSGEDSDKASDDSAAAGAYDEMLPQAVEAILETKSCSVSMLQRRVKLGYSRAARIVDQMEELGIVGPYEGAKPRSVLVDRAGWHSIQVQLGLVRDEAMELAADMSEEDY